MKPLEILQRDREQTRNMSERVGKNRTRVFLERAQKDLNQRLDQAVGAGKEGFTVTQMRTALAQVDAVLGDLRKGIGRTVMETGKEVAELSSDNAVRYLEAAERDYRGSTRPLALDRETLVDRAVAGTQSSLLRRIMSDPDHPGHKGILSRYGDNVVGFFEDELQQRLVAKVPWDETKQRLINQSPFLQEAPASWAERIVRTETMYAAGKSGLDSIQQAQDELGDMVKILSATFDDRTGSDSYAVHGQIRRPNEPFESWFGLYMHPPNRPNDREVVVPHRICWEIPSELKWKSDGEIAGRWVKEGRKGSPPARPKMTTIALERFGKDDELTADPRKEEPEKVQAQVSEQLAPPIPEPEVTRAGEFPTVKAPVTNPKLVSSQDIQRSDAFMTDMLEPEERSAIANFGKDMYVPMRAAATKTREEFAKWLHEKGEAPSLRAASLDYQKYKRMVDAAEKGLERVKAQGRNVDGISTVYRGITVSKDVAKRLLEEDTHNFDTVTSTSWRYDEARKFGLPKNKDEVGIVYEIKRAPGSGVLIGSRAAAATEAEIVYGKTKFKVVKRERIEGEATIKITLEEAGHEVAKGAELPSPIAVRPRRAYEPPPEGGWALNDFKNQSVYVLGREGALESFASRTKEVFGNSMGPQEIRDLIAVDAADPGRSGSLSVYPYDLQSSKKRALKMVFSNEDVEMSRLYYRDHADGKLVVEHSFFEITVEAQGKGTGRQVLREQFRQYLELGVNRVELEAAWVGKYTWLKMGFKLNEAEYPLSRLKGEFGDWMHNNGVAPETSKAILDQIDSGHSLAVTEVGGRKMGKEFLLDHGKNNDNLLPLSIDIDPNDPNFRIAAEYVGL